MASFKSSPLFYSALLLIGGVVLGETWLVYSQLSQVASVATKVETKRMELRAYTGLAPFPSRENLVALEADRQQVEKTRDEIRKSLSSKSEIANALATAAVPTSPTDAYFDIANYVERIRNSAKEAGVLLPTEDRLGFSDYKTTGPERELLAAVFKQRQFAEYLLKTLIAAKPHAIDSLLRERPLTPDQQRQIAEAIASGQPSPEFSGTNSGDFFVIDPRTSAAVKDFVETKAFRLTFVGTTASLRQLLNELGRFELPVVVRSVEVEAMNGGGRPAKSSLSAAANPFGASTVVESNPVDSVKPLVEQVDSRFEVTVEFVSLIDKTIPVSSSESPTS